MITSVIRLAIMLIILNGVKIVAATRFYPFGRWAQSTECASVRRKIEKSQIGFRIASFRLLIRFYAASHSVWAELADRQWPIGYAVMLSTEYEWTAINCRFFLLLRCSRHQAIPNSEKWQHISLASHRSATKTRMRREA